VSQIKFLSFNLIILILILKVYPLVDEFIFIKLDIQFIFCFKKLILKYLQKYTFFLISSYSLFLASFIYDLINKSALLIGIELSF
jgi:hypothetical protein